jgi:DNA-binding transcriptional LysR family regulator
MSYKPRKILVPTELLESFIAVCELGSFTRAAEALSLTQPAISAQIKRLQQLVGGELFTKDSLGLNLTTRGKDIKKHARRMLSINDQILGIAGHGPGSRSIRIGISVSFAELILLDAFAACEEACRAEHHLQFRSASYNQLSADLENGFLDIAMMVLPGGDLPDVYSRWEEPMVWMRANGLTVSPGAPLPIVSVSNSVLHDIGMKALEKANLSAVIRFSGVDYLSAQTAVKVGMGYMAIPLRARREGMVVADEYFLPKLPPVAMGIRLREGLDVSSLNPMLRALEGAMKPAGPILISACSGLPEPEANLRHPSDRAPQKGMLVRPDPHATLSLLPVANRVD